MRAVQIRLVPFGVGHERRLLCGQLTAAWMAMCLKASARRNAEEVGGDVPECGRPHGDDLGIAPDDDRVGVMADVAPSPHRWVAHDHEAGDVVDDSVHPSCPESGAVTALVPSGVGRRAVQHSVHREAQQRPHREPQVHTEAAERARAARTTTRVADRRTVAALHELLHPLARHLGAIPLGLRQAALDGASRFLTDQRVVTLHDSSHARRRC